MAKIQIADGKISSSADYSLYHGTTKVADIEQNAISGSSTSTGSFGDGRFDNKVGIGTVAPNRQLEIGHATEPVIRLTRTDSTIVDTENLGSIHFSGDDPATDTTGAIIQARAEGAWATNDYPSALLFYTTPASSGDVVERMRITNAGKVGIGTSVPTENLTVSGSASTYIGITGGGAGHNAGILLDKSGGATNMWTINADGGASDRLLFSDTAGNYNFLLAQGGNIGIGTSSPDSTLHIHTATGGSITPHTAADDLVVENSDHGGISILTPNDKSGVIYFGAPASNVEAQLNYDHGNTEMKLGTIDSGGYLIFATDSNTEAMRIDSSQNILFQTANQKISGSSTSTGSFGKVSVGCAPQTTTVKLAVAGDMYLGAGAKGSAAQNTLHVQGTGITLSEGDRDRASLHSTYSDGTDGGMIFKVRQSSSPSERMRIHTNGNVGIGTTSPGSKLVVEGLDPGSGNALIEAKYTNNVNNPIMRLINENTGGNPTDNTGLYIDNRGGGSDSYSLRIVNSSSEVFAVRANGKVGIGTDSPTAKLHLDDGSIHMTNFDHMSCSFDNASAANYWHLTQEAGTGGFGFNFKATSGIPLFFLSADTDTKYGAFVLKDADTNNGHGYFLLDRVAEVFDGAAQNDVVFGANNSSFVAIGTELVANWFMDTSGNILHMGRTTGDAEHYFTADGIAHHDGDVIAYSSTIGSDIRLKENIFEISGSLDKVKKLRPIEFDWKKKIKRPHELGLIAQEVEKIEPLLVKDVEAIGSATKYLDGDDTYKTVDYAKLTILLTDAIKEQQEQIDELKQQIEEIKK